MLITVVLGYIALVELVINAILFLAVCILAKNDSAEKLRKSFESKNNE